MKILKMCFLPILFLIATIIAVINMQFITEFIAGILENKSKIVVDEANEYAKDYDFKFVKFSQDFIPYSFGDLKNILFTVINNGWETFTFYCPSEYKECLDDIKVLSDDEVLLTNINNFTHPFNNFQSIETTYYDSGEVNLKINKIYNQEKITKINTYVDKVMTDNINSDMDTIDKIKVIHDYIIKNTKYDVEKNNKGVSTYESNTAFGVFFQNYGICSGYTDAMAIFLTRLDLKNFKVASTTHVWNAVFINDEWLHLDLTWNDPVSNDGKDNLWHKYFLIKTQTFSELDKSDETDHIFDKSVYLEFKS